MIIRLIVSVIIKYKLLSTNLYLAHDMTKKDYLLLPQCVVVIFSCLIVSLTYAQVKPGIEVLLEKQLHLVQGKRIALITNPTGVTSKLVSTIDALHNHPEIQLVALFGPEHGVRGDVFAGAHIADTLDHKTGIPVYSLYGKTKTPTSTMLKDVDVLIYDIQDVGSRAYTYIYTMALAMQAAAKHDIPFIVLDRPNPLGGELIEGPILDEKFKSFIGLYPIPYIYGLTVGELAHFFNTEFQINAELTVVTMLGWQRHMHFDDTGLPWVPTSPHVPNAQTAFYIAATGCIGELQVINEGVGYTLPFQLLGQTWINGLEFADELNDQNLPGVTFRPLHYRPYYFGHKGKVLSGVQIHITNPQFFRPMLTQLHIMAALLKLYQSQNLFNPDRLLSFYRAIGTDEIRYQLQHRESPHDIYESWQNELTRYRQRRLKYLLY